MQIDDLLTDALYAVWDGFKGDVEPSLWRSSFLTMLKAVDEGIAQVPDTSADFIEQLRSSAAVFSAFKAHAEQKELVALLLDENGQARDFQEFKAAAQPITDDYNKTWLRTEYNHAQRSARMGAIWKGYERDADIFPNLRYLKTRSTHPDPGHLELVGTVKPINDPFWDYHYPPTRWNCLCDVEQTDDEVTKDEPAKPLPADPGLDNNSGKTGELFSDSHPYYTGVDAKSYKAIKKEAKRLYDEAKRKP